MLLSCETPRGGAYDIRAAPTESGLADASVEGKIDPRTGQTDVIPRVYLAIDCLSRDRKDLIDKFGDSVEQQPRCALNGYGFADQQIADAFISTSRAVIYSFIASGLEVVYFNYASDVCDLFFGDPTEHTDFAGLRQAQGGLPRSAAYGLGGFRASGLERGRRDPKARFIIWFSLVDYSHLCTYVLGGDVPGIWRDTGLYDYDATTDMSGLSTTEIAPTDPTDAGPSTPSALAVWEEWLTTRTVE